MNNKNALHLPLTLAISLIMIPFAAMANAGSPMMWFGMLHALVLNAIIGYSEHRILHRRGFHNKAGLVILANYASMIACYYYIAPYFAYQLGNHDFWAIHSHEGVYKMHTFFIGFALSFIASLIIEYPFVRYALKDKSQREHFQRTFIRANLVTNVILLLIYIFLLKLGGHW